MRVPEDRSERRQSGAAAVWMRAAAGLCAGLAMVPGALAGGPKTPAGPLVLHGEELGFTPTPANIAGTGSINYTLQFVDDTHLLFTFNARSLLKRMPDAKPDDEDRNVAAELIELPTGRVLAKTEWRMRDRSRYLWPLGRGAFLLRVRQKLTVIQPMDNLKSGEPFREEPFLEIKRRIGYLSVSPMGDLVGIETLPQRVPKVQKAAMSNEPETEEVRIADGTPPVQINFYRMRREEHEGRRSVRAAVAGLIGADELIELPTTADGFLSVKRDETTPGYWVFDFVSHSGKRQELAAYQTSCAPRPYFISRSEFVAFGCRGSNDQQELSYFNLKGDQPWLNVLHGNQVSPSIAAAPAAGRFALSRTLVDGPVFNASELTSDTLTAQEITVMQGYDGRTLLRVQATPIQRMGQNFDLSPDGMKLAVLHANNVEVYTLPPATAKDEKALKEAMSMVPEENDAPIKMNAVPVKAGNEETTVPDAVAASVAAEKPEAAGDEAAGAARRPEVHYILDGDPQAAEPGEKPRRKAPSLYGEGQPEDGRGKNGSDPDASSSGSDKPH